MADSKSTDKLQLLTRAATEMVKTNPTLVERIKSLNITWCEVGGVIAPVVRLEFHEPKRGGPIVL